MPDISQFIASDNITYDLKDSTAREHIQDHNNPHQVTAEQAGAVPESELDGETSTVTGSIVTFETESAQVLPSVTVDIDPVQNLHGYDHPWPAGGGKNLLPKGITSENHGIIYTVQDNGEVIITGTASSTSFWCVKFTIPAGTYIINGCPSGGDTSTYRIDVRTSLGGNLISSINPDTGTGTTFTISESLTAYLNIRIASGYSAPSAGLKFSPMIRLSTVTDATFAPYSNICPISGWDGCEVERTGKNLIPSGTDTSKGFIAGKYPAPDGTYIANAGWNTSEYFKLKPNTVYCYSNTLGKTSSNVGILFYDSNYNFIGSARIQNAPTVFTTPSDVVFAQAGIYVDTSTNGFNQIELGSTATTYEPYSGTTYSISFPSSAGTVYGGTLDVTNGVLTVTWVFHAVSFFSWGKYDATYKRFYCRTTDKKIYPEVRRSPFVSSAFISIADGRPISDIPNYGIYGGAATKDIYIKCTDYSIVSDFVTAFGSQQIGYELATPVTYQLTPQQITALLGQNNLWADTGDSTVIYRTGKLALLSDVADSEEKVREDLNTKIDSLAATDVGAAKDSSIAPVEPTSTASANYAVGDHLMLGGVLYEVTVSIASGEAITQGTNVTPATIMESMAELAGAIPQHYNASTNPTGYLTISDLPLYDGTVI